MANRLSALTTVAALSGAFVAADEGPAFSGDLRSAAARAERARRPLLLAFGAAWCVECEDLWDDVWRSERVRELLSRFELVSVDVERDVSTARSYDVRAVPQMVLFDSTGAPRVRLLGRPLSEEIESVLRGFLEETSTTPEVRPGHRLRVRPVGPLRHLQWPDGSYRGLSICFTNVGYGPLNLQSQSPFQSLRLGLIPRPASTLARGQTEVRATATWVNVWAFRWTDLLIDYEGIQSTASIARGLTDTLQVEIQLENRSRFGGVMDGLIEEFHRLAGTDPHGRDQVPPGGFDFVVGTDKPAKLWNGSDRGFYAHNAVVTVQHNVTCGGESYPAFSYALSARLDLAESEDLESGVPFDLSASTAVSRRFGPLYLYLSGGYALFGRDRFRGMRLRGSQLSTLAAVEWQFSDRRSLIVQYLGSQGVSKSMVYFERPSHEVTLGYKQEVAPGKVLEIGLIENIIAFDNSPDLGLHLGYSQRF